MFVFNILYGFEQEHVIASTVILKHFQEYYTIY